ncbi:MAG: MFS transporter, partial [Dehalococcoidia bacterium]
SMLGAQVAGAVINFVGLGQTYFVAAAAYLASWLCMAMMRPVPKERVATPTRGSTGQELLAGLRYVRAHGALKGVIGVTIVMNFFLFSYQTMIPVFADGLHVNAFWAGLLASAPGAGALVGAALIAGWASGRIGRGWIFVGGSAIAMVCLFTFAASGAYTLSLAALLIAGIGQSGFGTMQGSLTLTAAEPAMRGRVMGVLSMSIGVGPFGMATLGVVAQALGAPRAVMLSVGIGAVLLLLWAWRSPALRAIR